MAYQYADCSFCGGKVEEKVVTVDYRWAGELIIIKGVPAGVCNQCGEQYLRGEIAEHMEQLAKRKTPIAEEIKVPVTTLA
jgi:YgiT-type zinc finger domain-containing protein